MNRKEIFVLSVGIFLTFTAWLIVSVYEAFTASKIKEQISIPNVQNYEIDQNLLQRLKDAKE